MIYDHEPKEIGDWQQDVGKWAKEAFPNATEESIIARLRCKVIAKLHPGCVADELADVVLLVFHLASIRGDNLEHEVRTKYEARTRRLIREKRDE